MTWLVALLILMVPAIGMASAFVNLDAPSEPEWRRDITYHRNHYDGDTEGKIVSYDGIASAEYNPEFWEVGWTGPGSGSTVPEQVVVEVNYRFSVRGDVECQLDIGSGEIKDVSLPSDVDIDNVSITGSHLSFNVISDKGGLNRYNFTIAATVETSVEMVFCGWTDADGSHYDPGDIIDTNCTDLYAEWCDPYVWMLDGFDINRNEISWTSRSSDCYIPTILGSEIPYESRSEYTVHTEPAEGPTMYNTIYTFDEETELGETLGTGTYRSSDPTNPETVRIGEINFWESSNSIRTTDLDGDVILDNIKLVGKNDVNHGDGEGGIYANGHKLIIGTNVSSPADIDLTEYPQVFGGSSGGSIGSTDVAIFSGTYYNVIAGSQNGKVDGDTGLVVRGDTIILDTVIGGNSGGNSGDDGNVVTGSTNVYMLGNVWMPGDYYEESCLGNGDRFDSIPLIEESTILTGGSNNGSVKNTNVFISNDAELWDVQAGGRRGDSSVSGTAYTEASGSSLVKHVLCGSITDGINIENANRHSVTKTKLTVDEGARVGSVFGAGYDTYYSPISSSMYGEGSSVSISIGGGTIGYVYGGGYRGTIGTETEPIDSIDIVMTGGTVLGDVFGGGRGGLDKVVHDGDSENSEGGTGHRDSTGYSQVFADRISVEIYGGTVEGSIYGGGESVPVLGSYNGVKFEKEHGFRIGTGVASVTCDSVSVSVDGGTVDGDVFGAGKGVDLTDTVIHDGDEFHRTAFIFAMDGTGLQMIEWCKGSGGTVLETDANHLNYASLYGHTTVTVSEAKVGGSVYGGGEYGRVGPIYDDGHVTETITINLEKDADIGGSVYGGGFGIKGQTSTNASTRNITVNGATIEGSIYGGSSYGDDNCINEGNTLYFSKGEVYIKVLSGDISHGNIYGGGYRGYSYMDVDIDVGVPALDSGTPSMDTLLVRSVYGGASVGISGQGDEYTSVLLIGNTTIDLGNLYDTGGSPYSKFALIGDVFGEGDYCKIKGTSKVTFTGFKQEGNSLLSVQKAGTLTIVGSELDIIGNVDGSTPVASERLSLNMIGNLILMKHATHGPSVLELHSAASQIGGYSSLEADGKVGNAPDLDSETLELNEIAVHGGMLMSILGEDNSGKTTEKIQGYSLVDNGGSNYYGTFAMGVTKNVASDSTGFYIERGGEYIPTREAHYEYQLGGTDLVGITMWYVAGVYLVETTMILEDNTGMETISAESAIMAPKIVRGSTVQYVGGYVYSYNPGSLKLVSEYSTDSGGTNDEFKLTLGSPGNNNLYLGDGLNVTFPQDKPVDFEGSGVSINLRIETLPGFNTTGYAGTVILHMVEMQGGILVNSFDVRVGVYLRTALDTMTIEETVVMRSNRNGNNYVGSVDLYLPALKDNAMAEYSITLNNEVSGVLTLKTVSTNLNKNGWQTSEYYETEGIIETSNPGNSMYLGVGGVYSPVISFNYSVESTTKEFDDINLTVWLKDLASEDKGSYTIILKPTIAEEFELQFLDRDLVSDEGIKWGAHEEIFSLILEFGSVMDREFTTTDDLHLAVNRGFDADFLKNNPMTDGQTYCQFIKNKINEDDSILLHTGSGDLRRIVVGSASEVGTNLDSTKYEIVPISEFLDRYVKYKPNTTYGDLEFDYSSYPRWYDTDACLTVFNFETPITADTNVYAGYGIEITIHPFTTEISKPMDGTTPLTVVPSEMLVSLPGTVIDLDKIYSSLHITEGYEKFTGDCWYTENGSAIESPTAFTPRTDADVYLKLQKAHYSITLNVWDGDGKCTQYEWNGSGSNSYSMKLDGNDATSASTTYGSEVEILFDYAAGFRIKSITGTTGHGSYGGIGSESKEVSGFNTNHTLRFSMPDSWITIDVFMTDKRIVTVVLPDGVADNDLFGVTLTKTDDGKLGVKIEDRSSGGELASTAKMETSASAATLLGHGTSYGSKAFLITAYIGDDRILCEPNGDAYEDLALSEFDYDIEVLVYVSVKWTMTIEGDGYSVERHRILDPTDMGNRVKDSEEYSSEKAPAYVLTGDLLLAKSSDAESTLYRLGVTGLSNTAVELVYRVDGSTNPSMHGPVFRSILTIKLSFSVDSRVVEPGDWVTSPAVTVTGDNPLSMEYMGIDGNHLIYKDTECITGKYTVNVSCLGFEDHTEQITIERSGTVEITMNAIEYTIHISSPSDNISEDRTWYVNGSRSFSDIIGSSAEADLWFYSTDGTNYDRIIPTKISPLLFSSTNELWILGIPSLEDSGAHPGTNPVIILLSEQGDVNGTHSVTVIEGLGNIDLNGTVAGEPVSAAYRTTVDGATLTVSGFPDGTGAWMLSGDGLSVIITVVSGLEAI